MDERYDGYKALVERALASRFAPAGDGADGLREAMRYSLLAGGKRIRPILCLEFARVCGGDVTRTLPAACGLEMLHTYSLIHDDLPCMDDDDERRGMPTNHRAFGETTAVLAGDCLQAEAFAAVAGAPLGPAERAGCCAILARAAGLSGICGGQFMDLAGPADAPGLSATELLKTASLMGASCAMGAAAAGASEERICAAEGFGLSLGMAFQCRDDELDGDGFCALLGAAKCAELTEMYTQRALELLASFDDTAFLRSLTLWLCGRDS